MTYREEDDTVPELYIRVEEDGVEKLGHYIKLSEESDREAEQGEEQDSSPSSSSSSSCGGKRSIWFWIKLALLLAFLSALALAAYKWLVPLIMDEVRFFLHLQNITHYMLLLCCLILYQLGLIRVSKHWTQVSMIH